MRLTELPVNWLDSLKYDQAGLIPAIVQEKEGGKVLMMAYMNREALEKTLLTGETWFYSRSRRELWHKGATSGHKQYVKQVRYDCDQDTLLFLVDQVGGACHDGYKSCFYRQLTARGSELDQEPVFDPGQVYREEAKTEPAEDRPTAEAAVMEEVYRVIMDRKANRPEGSYTAYLFNQGLDKICKKVGEEAAEVIIAAKNKSRTEILYEVADLWYHTLVLLGEHEIEPAEVFAQLRQRR